MRHAKLLLSLVLLGATAQAAQRNVLFIAVDDLRPELGAYGRDYITSPHIDQLAESGLLFERHYVQAPTCGASRYALLTGTYSTPPFSGNGALLRRAAKLTEAPDALPPTLPAWLRQHGYQTIAAGKGNKTPKNRAMPAQRMEQGTGFICIVRRPPAEIRQGGQSVNQEASPPVNAETQSTTQIARSWQKSRCPVCFFARKRLSAKFLYEPCATCSVSPLALDSTGEHRRTPASHRDHPITQPTHLKSPPT